MMQERRLDNAFSIFVIINLCVVSRVGFVWDIYVCMTCGNNCALFGEKRVKLGVQMRTSGNEVPIVFLKEDGDTSVSNKTT